MVLFPAILWFALFVMFGLYIASMIIEDYMLAMVVGTMAVGILGCVVWVTFG